MTLPQKASKDYLHRQVLDLIRTAEQNGLVFTVELKSCYPWSRGNYEMVASVRDTPVINTNKALELRDKEILDTFNALAQNSNDQEACAQETMKQTGCTYPRLRAAFQAIEDNPKHAYWKT